MPVYGLTTEGLIIPSLTVLRQEFEAALRASFSASLPLGDRSFFGVLNGIYSERLRLVYERMQQVYNAQDPNKATGQSLDVACAYTGTFRLPATYSTVILTLCGAPTTAVGTGFQARTISTQKVFQTVLDVALVAAGAWVGATNYELGDRRSNGGECYEVTTAGTSNATGGPTGTDPEADIVDGTAHWRWIGTGDGVADVTARATITGETTAFARDLTDIVNPTSGVVTCINLNDANTGRKQQTDESLRILREAELASKGTAPIDALTADLLKLAGVTSVTIFWNEQDLTDADGIPPHSIEPMIRGGENQAIFDALLAGVAIGIRTYGNPTGGVSGTAIDSQGTAHVMRFSRPTEIPVYVIVNVTKDPDAYPADGDDQIAQAIVTWGDARATGADAVASAIGARAFAIDGVLDVEVLIGTAPTPTTSTTIAISKRQLATYDTSRITVNATDGTP